jgi:hypothetical protein
LTTNTWPVTNEEYDSRPVALDRHDRDGIGPGDRSSVRRRAAFTSGGASAPSAFAERSGDRPDQTGGLPRRWWRTPGLATHGSRSGGWHTRRHACRRSRQDCRRCSGCVRESCTFENRIETGGSTSHDERRRSIPPRRTETATALDFSGSCLGFSRTNWSRCA